ncbi:MAG: DinB family protein [Phycisphaerales bacterium]|nr:DinB family protein [Phycisphaerales bacterium]
MQDATYKRIVLSQFDAAFVMLEECIRKCPGTKWRSKVGNWQFWHVAYHALYGVDGYTARKSTDWKPHAKYHPGGMADVMDEFPTREISKRVMLDYLAHCRRKLSASVKRETPASLRGEAGFPWLHFSRAELLVYNLRHFQHHIGPLGALLRRAKVDTKWCKDAKAAR